MTHTNRAALVEKANQIVTNAIAAYKDGYHVSYRDVSDEILACIEPIIRKQAFREAAKVAREKYAVPGWNASAKNAGISIATAIEAME